MASGIPTSLLGRKSPVRMILRNSYIFYVISLYIYYVLYSSVQQCTALYRYSVRYIRVTYNLETVGGLSTAVVAGGARG